MLLAGKQIVYDFNPQQGMDVGRELLGMWDEAQKFIFSIKQMHVGICNALEDVQKTI